MDKNQKMVDFLLTCPTISENPLYFNFGTVEDKAHQIITSYDDVLLQKPYIDGSVAKRYTCSIDGFKTLTTNPVIPNMPAENLEDFDEAQDLLDWINDCGEEFIFPDFGNNCIIDSMKCLTAHPEIFSIQDNLSPSVAVYRIRVQIDYLDISKRIWT